MAPIAEPVVGWMFTGLGGTRNLARSLMFHHDIDPDSHPGALTELADVLGDELMSVTRRTLEELDLLAKDDSRD